MKQAKWFYEAVVYSLDVRSFYDGDGDGLGDIKGLIQKLGYLSDLGVDCIWLAPFYVSKEYDGGYDVMDYYQIDPRLGTMEDFRVLIDETRSLGIRIILDLVINHTSIFHPWFQRAIADPGSRYYDYYIWKDQKPVNDRESVAFPTVEDSNWAYQPTVGAYYYHSFYHHQADLNMTNPNVQQEVLRVLNFWMGTGISGFRLDAVPRILQEKGGNRYESDPYKLLNVWRQTVAAHDEAAILIGEADVDPKTYSTYLEEGRLAALFNFYINNYTFLALAKEEAAPLEKALKTLPFNHDEHYLTFLRNHDELDLDILKKKERKVVYDAFAPSESMRIYDRGIRRRLPPMLDNDPDRIKLAMSLLFSLPGTPVLRYGEEIGMGDDLNLPERKSVRTAMQWSAEPNAGFSEISPQALRYALIREGEYGYSHVNVETQTEKVDSLLRHVKALIGNRKRWAEWFVSGRFVLWSAVGDSILCYGYERGDGCVVMVHNLSGEPVNTEWPVPLHGQEQNPITLDLGRYGYRWLLVTKEAITHIGGN